MLLSRLGWMVMCIGLTVHSVLAFEAEKTEISTEEIVSSLPLDQSCLNYCITGICVWLRCGLSGCSIETSIQVRHYNPDLVVSVYDELGENTWREAEAILAETTEGAAKAIVGLFSKAPVGGGHRVEGGNQQIDQSLRFKEASAIGHPLASIGNTIKEIDFFCPSEAESFIPYFYSELDALSWRLGFSEQLYLQNLLPGQRVIGSGFLQQWGPVWPRTGFVLQKDDVKAAAIIAQRAGNIVTQTAQPHIYLPLNGNGYNRTRLPGELIENDEDTGVWQMLAPKQDNECYIFGENDIAGPSWSTGRQSEDNRYAFALWRPYECCRDRGRYLFTVPLQVCL